MISHFEDLSYLGSGSFGEVFKVRRLADNQVYVRKSVRIKELSERERSDAINEVCILSSMKSPYVVRYFDSFIENDSLHIIMEFCNKGDLQNLLKKQKEKSSGSVFLREEVTWSISLQVILGLYYLHSQKVLHRDLKTANVFLSKRKDASMLENKVFDVKIGDLGVAKLLETSTAFAQTMVGTPYYLSPELCSDQPYKDKSDCWALGVLLYECCTNRHPFEALNQFALIMKIIKGSFELPSEDSCSPLLRNLIACLLDKNPDSRPSIKDLLNDAAIRNLLILYDIPLPDELLGCPVTDRLGPSDVGDCKLSRGTGVEADANVIDTTVTDTIDSTYAIDDLSAAAQQKDQQNHHRPSQEKRTHSALQSKPTPMGAKSSDRDQRPSAKQVGVPIPRVGKVVQGNRVRDASRPHIVSSKARTQHQKPRVQNNPSYKTEAAFPPTVALGRSDSIDSKAMDGWMEDDAIVSDSKRLDSEMHSELSQSIGSGFKGVGDGFDTLRREFTSSLTRAEDKTAFDGHSSIKDESSASPNHRFEESEYSKETADCGAERALFDGSNSLTINRNRVINETNSAANDDPNDEEYDDDFESGDETVVDANANSCQDNDDDSFADDRDLWMTKWSDRRGEISASMDSYDDEGILDLENFIEESRDSLRNELGIQMFRRIYDLLQRCQGSPGEEEIIDLYEALPDHQVASDVVFRMKVLISIQEGLDSNRN